MKQPQRTNKLNGNKHKYIFVVGGVMSGVGKGVTTSSIGTILQSYGYNISVIKADPYLNVDAGTMNPTEHGEVFVLDSGLETDQDMGNYERFLNKTLPGENYMTNGMIFKHVIDKERRLEYNGKCVEPTYHITEEILRRIDESVKKTFADITVVEIGGTVGEYQNAIFIEAARLLRLKNPRDVMVVMVSYLPVPSMIGEMKTKPTQNAVRQLNSYGVTPDIIIARSDQPLDEKRKEKIANMCGLIPEHVISAPDVTSIYDVPLNFEKDGFGNQILSFFDLTKKTKSNLTDWKQFRDAVMDSTALKENGRSISIAVVGKYFDTGDYVLSDAYLSVIEALKISAVHSQTGLTLTWINSKQFEDGTLDINTLSSYDGILIPGGFGSSGIEGKIKTIQYARTHNIPFFGICYGMQLMCVEYARNVLGFEGAHTTEVKQETPHPIVTILNEQKEKLEGSQFGGSMRLGAYPCSIKKNTLAFMCYKTHNISERHRHRYEINPVYVQSLEEAGLIFSGSSPDGTLKEIAELPESMHPFFIGTQFHPEFLARPLSPHPLFSGFIHACKVRKNNI